MAGLKQQDRKACGGIQKFFSDQLAATEDLGYPLRGEWEGSRAIHVYNDRYRVIWREMPETEDYTGAEVGLKKPLSGGRVYERPPD